MSGTWSNNNTNYNMNMANNSAMGYNQMVPGNNYTAGYPAMTATSNTSNYGTMTPNSMVATNAGATGMNNYMQGMYNNTKPTNNVSGNYAMNNSSGNAVGYMNNATNSSVNSSYIQAPASQQQQYNMTNSAAMYATSGAVNPAQMNTYPANYNNQTSIVNNNASYGYDQTTTGQFVGAGNQASNTNNMAVSSSLNNASLADKNRLVF